MRNLNILDVTIRDGSYAIGFQYSAIQVKEIVERLCSAGVKWVEVGHGIGLGAGKAGYSFISTDEEQVRAAYDAIGGAKGRVKLGVIAIPPVFKDVNELKRISPMLGFVRLACNVVQPSMLADFIPICRKMGLKTFVQMMRSSAVPPKMASASAKKLARYGAEVIYVVDTGGAFVPYDVAEYIKRVKSETGVAVGFHAHNNLGLAMANTLEAAKAGADFVDASLRGMGRGSGNVPLEMLTLTLKRLGLKCGIDERSVLSAADWLYDKLLKDLPKASSADAYIASKRRDFFPLHIVELIAAELKITIFDIIDDMEEVFPAGRDPTLDELENLIKKRGRDSKEVFKKIGLVL